MGLYSCGGVNNPSLADKLVDIGWAMGCSGGEYIISGDDWQVLEGYRCDKLSSGASRAISASGEKKDILAHTLEA